MSFAIALSFPGGRYHATAWGRHVNEAAPDWPPAPWRLLRALVAAWKRKCAADVLVNQHLPVALGKLIAPPVYKLPLAASGHTRHYMPSEKQTLVFDGFIALEPTAELGVCWPEAGLTCQEQEAVGRVLAQLSYLGRAESWCTARICADWASLPGAECGWLDTETGELHSATRENAEPVRLLCAHPQTWNQWTDYSAKAFKPEPAWHLLAETADLHKEKWSDPPGSCWTMYYRPANALAIQARRRVAHNVEETTHFIRYALDGTVLPLLTETVYVADLARRGLQSRFGKLFEGMASAVFSGKDAAGNLLTGHQHAFYLPTDEDGDGRLDHLTLYAPMGFGRDELKAADRFRRLYGPSGVELNLLLLGHGTNTDEVPLLAEARRWRSVTPFVPTRHYKTHGAKRDTLHFTRDKLAEMVLREELDRRKLSMPEVNPLQECELWRHAERKPAGRLLAWFKFRRERVFGDGRHSENGGAGFEIEFSEPVRGPIALGYACHFGLGLFVPME